ncbi:hypothetical protein L1765_12350 [Microaerobacter geothermalis]|nr:hypothetical protein [Microaerobacter geothermalis]
MDQKEVKVYDQRMQKLRDIKKETEEIKRKINLMSDHVIIEIGTGTGEFAIEISQHRLTQSPFHRLSIMVECICKELVSGEKCAN